MPRLTDAEIETIENGCVTACDFDYIDEELADYTVIHSVLLSSLFNEIRALKRDLIKEKRKPCPHDAAAIYSGAIECPACIDSDGSQDCELCGRPAGSYYDSSSSSDD